MRPSKLAPFEQCATELVKKYIDAFKPRAYMHSKNTQATLTPDAWKLVVTMWLEIKQKRTKKQAMRYLHEMKMEEIEQWVARFKLEEHT